jgi:hypothetical protein
MDAMRVILAGAASVAFVSAAQAQTATTFTAGARIASSAVNSAFASKADATHGVLTTPDINGGTLDGACVGCSTPAGGNFTNLQVKTTAGAIASLYNTGSAADGKIFDIYTSTASMNFRFLNDAYTASNTWLSAARSGYAITSVTITAPAIALNGTTTITGTLNVSGVLNLQAYTVATLPTCDSAANTTYAAVTDATAPTYNATVTGGGAVSIPVYCNGTHWTAH